MPNAKTLPLRLSSVDSLANDGLLDPALWVPAPKNASRTAKLIVTGFVLLVAAAALAPWQQTVFGTGRVIAFTPDERQQAVEAPVNGVVEKWFVHEGSQVEKGDPIVHMGDNDALLLSRLGDERAAVDSRFEAEQARVQSLRDRLQSIKRSQTAQVMSAEAEVDVARQEVASAAESLAAAEAEQETNDLNLRRQQDLQNRGLASRRDLELAELAARRSQASYVSAQAQYRAAKSKLDARKAAYERIKAAADAEVQNADASISSAEKELASTKAALAKLDVGIARQKAQTVYASQAGTIMRILKRRGGEQVKQGEQLAIFVPKTGDRAVELYVDGNDAALIQPGAHVRLQFEGWPAVQFSGWPSVAVGTFGGEVAFVDAADDGQGNFRVLVVPDREDEAWPEPVYLRQGVRAKGWFLLREVSLGMELWRRFNGFPPATDPPGETAVASKKFKAAAKLAGE